MNKKRRRKAAKEQKEEQLYRKFIESLKKGEANNKNTDSEMKQRNQIGESSDRNNGPRNQKQCSNDKKT